MSGLAVDGVVSAVREQIFLGRLRPGEHLDEGSLGRRLDVSRNTLREAFRILAQQRLVVHEPNRGVFVRRIDRKSARDIYAARRSLQCGALREAAVVRATLSTPGLPAIDPQEWGSRVAAVRTAVEEGRAAASWSDWLEVGSANGAFHVALSGLAGNDVVDRMVEQLLTESRLLFVDVASPREVHELYLTINERLLTLVEVGDLVRAAIVLEDYLLRAEHDLVGRL